MQFYFSLTFALPEGETLSAEALQAKLASLPLTLEPVSGNIESFTAHFSPEGDNVTVELEKARQEVENTLVGAQLTGMDLVETPSH
ncbi:hypothetical protein BGP77_01015 [Saccharospirillum sp. MSK14-1]|uniref:hypothetical protein n=1 Tax=Saccharospirillum sp. MSK14-1 TaxID=1897632 RepID=UPI000D3D0B59|nr:hypothetical protein [Saccharospirillum sp. MSK14-1]PTY35939.1 hypothetical protein BGP77_01015 [Saccharospirillum sp. MSK14-1]